MQRRFLMLAAAAAMLPVAGHPVLAQTAKVEVHDAWARATTSQAMAGGAFMSIKAVGGADRLVSASSPVAATVELHETVSDGGVMKMRAVPAMVLEPGKAVELKPGGLHVMLIGLKQPLRQGESFPVTLTFEKAPPVTVTVKVQAAGAAAPAHSH